MSRGEPAEAYNRFVGEAACRSVSIGGFCNVPRLVPLLRGGSGDRPASFLAGL